MDILKDPNLQLVFLRRVTTDPVYLHGQGL